MSNDKYSNSKNGESDLAAKHESALKQLTVQADQLSTQKNQINNQRDEIKRLTEAVEAIKNAQPAPKIEVTDNIPARPLIIADEGLSKEGLVTQVGKLEDELFTEEKVVICLSESNDENANPLPIFSVGEQVQLVPRGINIAIKRKFVEVIARCKETKYTQERPDPTNPDYMVMKPRTALSYPFNVIRDDNPKGRAWLQAILHEAA